MIEQHALQRQVRGQVKRILPMEDFENYLRFELNLSPLTVETYLRDVRRFLDYLSAIGRRIDQVDIRDMTAWSIKCYASNMDPRSQAKQRSALRSYFAFEVGRGHCLSNPARLLDLPRIPYRLPRAPRTEDIERILDGCDLGNAFGIRDLALYELIFGSGLRESEACDLKLRMLSFEHGLVTVVGKGNVERMVPLSQRSMRDLRSYLVKARPLLLGKAKSSYVFLSKRGRQISRKSVWRNWRKLCVLAGIPSTVHGIRHAFATALLNGGAGVMDVKELLGHSSVMTTAIYLHVASDKLQAIHADCHPRGTKHRSAAR